MRYLVFALALLGASATVAHAQDAIPDLKGTWSGKGKSIVFGNHPHHPGAQTPNDPPRVRDIEATYVVEGQDGRLAWGRSASAISGLRSSALRRSPIPRSRSPGPSRATTGRSSAPTWMAISASRSSRPTAWRSATPITAPARRIRSSPPATSWIGNASDRRFGSRWRSRLSAVSDRSARRLPPRSNGYRVTGPSSAGARTFPEQRQADSRASAMPLRAVARLPSRQDPLRRHRDANHYCRHRSRWWNEP